jgi:hypothetical protein
MEFVTKLAEVIAVVMSIATAALIGYDALKLRAAGRVRKRD